MDYTKKIISHSNYWYNDGLKKAQANDLSGAIVSLRKSLQFNKVNIEARNLLGLMYYGRGEVSEALVEWILSKNLQPEENAANRYLKKIQSDPKQLEIINHAVKKYNQALMYCEQGGEDLAIIQLKRAIAEFPGMLKAHQLLALIYIHTGQTSKARQVLKEAKKIDPMNETTMRYIHEVNMGRSQSEKKEKKETGLKRRKPAAVEYNLGNETIIQPVHSTVKVLSTRSAAMYIVAGILIGAAVIWFLVSPAALQSKNEKHNQEVLQYSERINALEAQISALTRTLDQYRGTEEASGEQTAAGTAESYEYLMTASSQLSSGAYSYDVIAETLYNVNRNALGASGQALYDEIRSTIAEAACGTYYTLGIEAVNAGDYESAVKNLNMVVWMDDSYAEGDALLQLGKACMILDDYDTATAHFSRIKELFPDTDLAAEANIYIEEILEETGETSKTDNTEDSDTPSDSDETTEDSDSGETTE